LELVADFVVSSVSLEGTIRRGLSSMSLAWTRALAFFFTAGP
jgi:hypothetical protein